jgi:translation initiation factor IF-3
MRIHPRRNRKPVDLGPQFRINEHIKVDKIRLIDETGANVGIVATEKAVAMALERGYDLVEVFPKAEPPVCKILNYGQFRYEREREARKQKSQSKSVEVKGIRLSPRIGAHDLETRLGTAKSFLDNNDKVRVEIILRGREKAFAHLARGVIENFIAKLRESYDLNIEQPIQNAGGQLTAIVGKK